MSEIYWIRDMYTRRRERTYDESMQVSPVVAEEEPCITGYTEARRYAAGSDCIPGIRVNNEYRVVRDSKDRRIDTVIDVNRGVPTRSELMKLTQPKRLTTLDIRKYL